MIGFVGKGMVVGSALWLLVDDDHLQAGYRWAFALGVCAVGVVLWVLSRVLGDDEDEEEW